MAGGGGGGEVGGGGGWGAGGLGEGEFGGRGVDSEGTSLRYNTCWPCICPRLNSSHYVLLLL